MSTQQTAPTQYIKATNGITFAYRYLNTSTTKDVVPLVMHIHFRANMDFWDPLLINALASQRPIIIFDQAGVGRSDGNIATTYQGWADNVIALVQALGLEKFDLLGFSMGGYTVQMVALTAPHLIRKLIICGSGPSQPKEQVKGIVWPRDVRPKRPFELLATAKPDSKEEIEEGIAVSFFPETEAGRRAAREYFDRIYTRTIDPLHSFLGLDRTRVQQKAAAHWYDPKNEGNSFPRLGELKMPVLVLNGDDDVLIPTSHSWELLKGIENCQLIVYPNSGHGFIWQYAERVAGDVGRFLDGELDKVDAKL